MYHNRIKRYLNRHPRLETACACSPASAAPDHFAVLPLAGLPQLIQQAAIERAQLYRWAYEQALARRAR